MRDWEQFTVLIRWAHPTARSSNRLCSSLPLGVAANYTSKFPDQFYIHCHQVTTFQGLYVFFELCCLHRLTTSDSRSARYFNKSNDHAT